MNYKPGTAETMRLVNTAAANLSACAEGVRKSTAVIQRSSRSPAMNAADHKHLLDSKMQDLRGLTASCDIVAGRLMDLGVQIRRDGSQEESMAELLAVCRSIVDELQSQERDAYRVLGILRAGRAEASEAVRFGPSDDSTEDKKGRQRVREGGDAHP